MDNKQQDQHYQNEQTFSQPSAPPVFTSYGEPSNTRLTHSKLGIASFVMAIIAIIAIIITIALGVSSISQIINDPDYLEELMAITNDPTLLESDAELQQFIGTSLIGVVVAMIFLFGSLALAFVGLILGIIGLTAKYKKTIFALLGVIFNTIVLIGTVGMFVVSFFIAS